MGAPAPQKKYHFGLWFVFKISLSILRVFTENTSFSSVFKTSTQHCRLRDFSQKNLFMWPSLIWLEWEVYDVNSLLLPPPHWPIKIPHSVVRNLKGNQNISFLVKIVYNFAFTIQQFCFQVKFWTKFGSKQIKHFYFYFYSMFLLSELYLFVFRKIICNL